MSATPVLQLFSIPGEDHTWNRVKRDTYYLGMRNGVVKRDDHCKDKKSFQLSSPTNPKLVGLGV